MTHVPELSKKVLEAQIAPDPPQPFVEVRVGKRLMAITVECPGVEAADVEVTVTRASVRVRSRSQPERLDLFLALPMTAVAGLHWARFNHGVCDILVARAERSD